MRHLFWLALGLGLLSCGDEPEPAGGAMAAPSPHGDGSGDPPPPADGTPAGPDRREVDMTYVVTVEPLPVDTPCEDDGPAADWPMTLDVQQRRYGRLEPTAYDLVFSGSLLPDGERFKDVRRDYMTGRVDWRDERTMTDDGRTETFSRTVSGSFDRQALDLTVTKEDRLRTIGGYRRCETKVRLLGRPRVFGDPASLDGQYKLRFLAYGLDGDGRYCGDTAGQTPRPYPDIIWDVLEDGGRLHFATPGGLMRFSTPRPSADGTLLWNGPVYIADPNRGLRVPDGVIQARRFSPQEVDLTFEWHEWGDAEDCGYRFELRGRKLLPEFGRREGVYRVAVRREDTLRPADPEPLHTAVHLLEQANGFDLHLPGAVAFPPSYRNYDRVKDRWYRVPLTVEGATFRAQLGSAGEGEIITFEGGWLDDGLISLVSVHSLLTGYPDQWERYTFALRGLPRFVFDDEP